jgi:hypothetical protein
MNWASFHLCNSLYVHIGFFIAHQVVNQAMSSEHSAGLNRADSGIPTKKSAEPILRSKHELVVPHVSTFLTISVQ